MPTSRPSYNTVVAVGGTSLYLGQAATPTQSETAWNSNGTKDSYSSAPAAVGRGRRRLQHVLHRSGWQSHLGGAQPAARTKRLVADVSVVGDSLTGFDIYDSYDSARSAATATGLDDRRRHLAVGADHRRRLRPGRRRPRRAVPRAHLYGHLGAGTT